MEIGAPAEGAEHEDRQRRDEVGVPTTVDLVGCGPGDVLLAGPAVRALAEGAPGVVLLVDPEAEEAAGLLPEVDEVRVVTRRDGTATVALRPGHAGRGHDADRMLAAALEAGGRVPPEDDGRLRLRQPLPDVEELVPSEPYVVLHPGARHPERCWPAAACAETAQLLLAEGWAVVVTGGPGEVGLTARVTAGGGSRLVDLGGLTSLAQLAAVLDGAHVAVAASTAPAQLAAAAGTPVVLLLAPEADPGRRAPYGVPSVMLDLPWVTPLDALASVGKLVPR